MPSTSNIQYLRHKEINKEKWDECVVNAENGLIYAQSFYLDALCTGWGALISEDYRWVLPVTSKRKYGIAYLRQPNFLQQAGVFYRADTEVPWTDIIGWMQRNFRFWEINWNYATPANQLPASILTRTANNFILDLSKPYADIARNYSRDLQKNINRSRQFSLHYLHVNDYEKAIELYIEQYSKRIPHVTQQDYHSFRRACSFAKQKGTLLCREVKNSSNKTAAIALLLGDGKRLYNIMNTTTEEGKKTEANHFLINAIIKEFAGTKMLLDFEGSDLPGVKAFYENFGVTNQPYYLLRYNALPFPLKLLKK